MEPLSVIIIAGTVFVYALFSRVLDKTILTAPMLFAATGFAIGPAGRRRAELKCPRCGEHYSDQS